jgi:hypothetical protein
LLLCSSYLPLGVPNWTVTYIINTVPHQTPKRQEKIIDKRMVTMILVMPLEVSCYSALQVRPDQRVSWPHRDKGKRSVMSFIVLSLGDVLNVTEWIIL